MYTELKPPEDPQGGPSKNPEDWKKAIRLKKNFANNYKFKKVSQDHQNRIKIDYFSTNLKIDFSTNFQKSIRKLNPHLNCFKKMILY